MRPDDSAPYVGLRPFARADTKRFFGRGYEISELSSLIVANRWVLLYAASGTGKSSLLNAGVIDELERRSGMTVLPVGRIRLIADAGTRDPATGNVFVRDLLANWHTAGRADLPSSSGTTRRRGARRKIGQGGGPQISSPYAYSPSVELRGPVSLVEHLATLPQPADSEGRVLVIDQFEELFVLHPECWEQRAEFFGELRAALDEDPALRLVLAMREDYLATFERHAPALGNFPWTRYRLDLLGLRAAKRAATQPLEATNRRFDDLAADTLIKDLATSSVDVGGGVTATVVADRVEPVQLQLVCQRLWERLPPDLEIIGEAHVKQFGSVDDVLQELFNEAIEQVVEQFDLGADWLRTWIEEHFVTSLGTRNALYQTPVSTDGLPNAVFEVFREHQLIRTEYRAQALWHELSHDRLIEAIRSSNRVAWAESAPYGVDPAVANGNELLEVAATSQLTGVFEDAKQAALTALQVFRGVDDVPGVARATYALGHAKAALGEDDAVELLADAAPMLRDTGSSLASTAFVDAAVSAGNDGDIDGALRLVNEAIELARRQDDQFALGDALVVLGQLDQLDGDHQAARTAFTDAFAIAHACDNVALAVSAVHFRAFTQLRVDEAAGYEAALADLDTAFEDAAGIEDPIERNRLRAAILVDAGRIHIERGRLDEAVGAASEAIGEDRASAEAYEVRAGARWALGQLHDALTDYDRALGLSAGSVALRAQRAQVLVEVGDHNEDALRELDAVITEFDDIDPTDPLAAYARRSRADVLAAMGELDHALRDVEESLAMQPGNGWAYFTRARIRQAGGDEAGAVSDFARACEEREPRLPQRLAAQAAVLGEALSGGRS